MNKEETVYVVGRYDHFLQRYFESDRDVRQIIRLKTFYHTAEEAEREVQRLNGLDESDRSYYFWQAVRVATANGIV